MAVATSSPILFFDGASSGNPGVAGEGGVIFDSDGKKLTKFSWGLGNPLTIVHKCWQSIWACALITGRSPVRLVVIGILI
jgi:hypothetical protein